MKRILITRNHEVTYIGESSPDLKNKSGRYPSLNNFYQRMLWFLSLHFTNKKFKKFKS